MNKILLAALGAGIALSATAANAADGCGRGYHRGPYGHCRPNGGRNVGRGPVVVAPGLVIGNFYQGRGYWDGNGYRQNRYRYQNGWRYR
ncbi:GCG_CRPN prefix-to-repeats domain-containing protein [Sphingomonas bacterium]|uniref:GCG_CRPN prefix-to-repeats domain-containing protein n=1 Tax=Sphingomonas bacterium TaxID=1895847 RepID=UPI00157718ED|nr:hypothetical protein [Sphingomonas bacterium]